MQKNILKIGTALTLIIMVSGIVASPSSAVANALTTAENKGALQSCQSRERNIKAIMARMADRADKRLRLFDTVSERVQGFYRQNGVIIDGYDALLAQLNAKRQAAVAANQQVKSQSATFDCSIGDPKATASAFQEEVRNANAVYKEYKTALKDLIAGVKTALQGADE